LELASSRLWCPVAVAVGKAICRKQLPDSALLVDMQYPSCSVMLNLYTEEAANWTEVGHHELGAEEVFYCGDSVGPWREEQHVINVQQQNYWCVILSRLPEVPDGQRGIGSIG